MRHVYELVCSVQTSQMRMVSVLNYETAGSQSYLLEVWGDIVHKTRQQTRQQATQWRVSQAIAREKEPTT